MIVLFCLLIGACVGRLAASVARVGGAEWRQLCAIGGAVSAALTGWILSDYSGGGALDFSVLGSALLVALVVVSLMRAIRVHKSD